MQQHPRQRIAIALAAREHADGLEDVVFGEQETAEQAAQLGHGLLRRHVSTGHRACGVEASSSLYWSCAK